MSKLIDTPILSLTYEALAILLFVGAFLNVLGYADDDTVRRGTCLGVSLLLASAARRKN